ncbi:hypothetical protein V1511DRAFT_517110 [Dipodascopsis uninucleata]
MKRSKPVASAKALVSAFSVQKRARTLSEEADTDTRKGCDKFQQASDGKTNTREGSINNKYYLDQMTADVKEEDDQVFQIDYVSASDSDEDRNREPDIEVLEDLSSRPSRSRENSRNDSRTEDHIKVSVFTPMDANHVTLEHGELFALGYNESLVIQGVYCLQVLKGQIQLNGAVLNANSSEQSIFSFATHAIPRIENAQTGENKVSVSADEEEELFEELDKLVPDDIDIDPLLNHPTLFIVKSKHTGISEIEKVMKNVKILSQLDTKKSYSVIYEALHPPAVLNIPQAWRSQIDLASNNSDRKQYIVCGPKSSGKSTFCRLLSNGIISKTNHVVYLDIDPGQPEFGQPGNISVRLVDRFILGPPFSHAINDEHTFSLSFGHVTPRDEPDEYLKCVFSLISHYEKNFKSQNYPLVVNTVGWTKGQGVDILDKILARFVNNDSGHSISNVFYLGPALSQLDMDTNMELAHVLKGCGIEVKELEFFDDPKRKLLHKTHFIPADLRGLQLLSYFHMTNTDSWNFDSHMFAMRPWIVPYSTSTGDDMEAGVHAVEFLKFQDSRDILDEHVVLGLQGVVVSINLVKLEDGEMRIRYCAGSEIPIIDYDAGRFNHNCLGLAVIRAIDIEGRLMQLIAPDMVVSRISKLLDEGSKILLSRGTIALPIWALWDGNADNIAGYNLKDVPYLEIGNGTAGKVISNSMTAVGSQSLRVRRNVMRRGQQGRQGKV